MDSIIESVVAASLCVLVYCSVPCLYAPSVAQTWGRRCGLPLPHTSGPEAVGRWLLAWPRNRSTAGAMVGTDPACRRSLGTRTQPGTATAGHATGRSSLRHTQRDGNLLTKRALAVVRFANWCADVANHALVRASAKHVAPFGGTTVLNLAEVAPLLRPCGAPLVSRRMNEALCYAARACVQRTASIADQARRPGAGVRSGSATVWRS